MRPGPRNAITDVDGIAVGNAEDRAARTGVSVVVPSRPTVAAVDVRGGAPGTRETDLLRPENTVERVDAVVLSGGSAHGLEAAGGVAAALAVQGKGFEVLGHRVPIVPAAILFDLANGGDKAWGDEAPYRTLGRAALQAAGGALEIGNAGAGYGATAGGLKGGLGTASLVDDEGCTVGALVAVNSYGSVLMPGGPHFWAWPFERNGERRIRRVGPTRRATGLLQRGGGRRVGPGRAGQYDTGGGGDGCGAHASRRPSPCGHGTRRPGAGHSASPYAL
jgi:D-aminopeptidase